MEYTARPLTSDAVPSVAVPSLNVTSPVGDVPVTVAVKVTDVPYVDGFREEATVVVDCNI